MSTVFILLAVIVFLAFLVDWRDLLGVLRAGGWATLALFGVLTVLIYLVLMCPEAATHAPQTIPHH